MSTRPKGIPLFFCLLFCIAAMSGCSRETIESAGEDAARNAEIVQREVKRTERKARPQIQIVKREVKRAERKARPHIAKAERGLRVKTALTANEKLPKTIRVDAGENGVKLRGKVKTQAQKELAGRIARDTLEEGTTVTNDLEVTGN